MVGKHELFLSGATFVRNAIKFDFPVLESIRSVLPICDEFVVNVGDSEDSTLPLIQSLRDPKIKIVQSVWDPSLRTGGAVLSQQTNIALSRCRGRWVLYLQADEVVHERYLATINSCLQHADGRGEVEGLLFNFRHFYGSYQTYQKGPNWYRHEVRVIRNGVGISSWGDAQGFRRGQEKLRVLPCPAEIYHYGWARPLPTMFKKCMSFDALWHDDDWLERKYADRNPFVVYASCLNLARFEGTHPAVMEQRVARQSFRFDPGEVWRKIPWAIRVRERRRYLTHRFREHAERTVFRRPIGRYANYAVLKESTHET
jgi:glycosyltransferase involved in cell wall biosynthesis